MHSYEVMFILKPELEAAVEEDILGKVHGLIAEFNGEVVESDDWGKRRLAYEIDKINEGHYFLLKYKAAREVIPELEHFFKVTDEVIRFMCVREGE